VLRQTNAHSSFRICGDVCNARRSSSGISRRRSLWARRNRDPQGTGRRWSRATAKPQPALSIPFGRCARTDVPVHTRIQADSNRPDGWFISLHGVDSILAQGQTLPQVSDSLRRAYGKILHEPVLDVELKDFQKPYVIVGGEVGPASSLGMDTNPALQ